MVNLTEYGILFLNISFFFFLLGQRSEETFGNARKCFQFEMNSKMWRTTAGSIGEDKHKLKQLIKMFSKKLLCRFEQSCFNF